MILDDRSELASAATLTGFTGRRLVADVIDLAGPTLSPNAGGALVDGLYLVVQVATTFTSGGAATLTLELVSDAQGAVATDGTATRHFATGAIALAALTRGATLACIPLPMGQAERYLSLIANVGTAAFTAGALNAFITPEPATFRIYADNVA